MFYIYTITNLINYKIYVGQTTVPKNRWAAHKCEARSDRIKYPIHFAIRKYGIENFQFCIVNISDSQQEANCNEEFWIQILDSRGDGGYNLAIGGNSNSGWHHTSESKLKISEANKGKYQPSHTEEWKQHMSQIMCGRILSEEWRAKIAEGNRGKIVSEESKVKMSTSHVGKVATDKTLIKMSRSMTGKFAGEKSYAAKLNWELVSQIRKEYAEESISQRKLANKYNVSPSTIQSLIENKSWKI